MDYTILLNFLIETSYNQSYYVVLTLIIVTQIVHTFIQEGILDFQTNNLQQPQQLLINKFIRLFSLLQIILNINRDVSIIISALTSGLVIFKILIYRHKNEFIEKFYLCSNVITLYYVLLIYLDFNPGGYSSHIIILPFLSKICTQILIHKKFQQKNVSINDLFIIQNQQSNLQEQKLLYPKLDVKQMMMALKPKKLNDQAVLYGSLLLIQDKKIESLHYLQFIQSSKQIHLSNLNTIKLNRLYNKLIQKLYNLLVQQNVDQADSIKQFLLLEASSEQIKNKIIHLMTLKIEFLKELYQMRIEKTNIKNLTQQLLDYKLILQEQYLNNGGDKQKRVYCFYLSEILNDYISANELNSILAVNEDKQNKILLGQQYLSNNIIYLIIEYNNDLEIIKCSNNIQLLNLQQNLIINKQINILIPQTIQSYHCKLTQEFFINCSSKYLRKLNINIYLDQKQNISQVEFGLDILYQQNNIQFIVFLQQLINQQYMFLMNSSQYITNVSQNLQQILQQYQFDLLNKYITQFIPNFDDYLNNEEFINIYNIELIQYKLSVNMQIYIKRMNNQPIFYIVFIDTLKTIFKKSTSIQLIISDRQSLDEDIRILKPMEMEEQFQEEYQCVSKAIMAVDNTINHTRTFSPKDNIQIPFIEYESRFYETKVQQVESLQNYKKEIYVENMQHYKNSSSQMSTLQGIRRSKYYKKYELVQKSSELNAFSVNHRLFLMIFILGMLIQLILQLIQLLSINTSFTKLVSAVDLLQIENYIYQPLATFLVTRWSILNYNGYYNTKQITYDNLEQLLVFPYSNLDLGFDDLAINIHKLLNRPELQQFLEFTQVDLQIYTDTATGDNFTLSVRNSIDLLLNYQYAIKMSYAIEGTVDTDSPNIYFTYKNYIPMNEVFTILNQQVYQDALNNTGILQNLKITFLIISICFLVLFIILSLYYCTKIEGYVFNYLYILKNIDKLHIDNEFKRLQNLQEQVQNDPTLIYNFVFDLEQSELKIQQYKQKDDESLKRSKRNQNDQGIQYGLQMTWLILVLLTILLGTILTFLWSNSFLNLFPNTINLYMKFSQVGTDIPTMFAMREFLYSKTLFPYFSEDDLQSVLELVKKSVNTVQQFNNVSYDKNIVLMSDSFYNYLQEINNNNLCNYLDKNMTIKAQDICPLIMNGNMARGLKSLLIYMVNYIQTDMDVNNLTSRSIAPVLELEAAFLVSMVIKGINKKFNSDLYEQTVALLNTLIVQYIFICRLSVIHSLYLSYSQYWELQLNIDNL
ncbi:hypothetical protein pb186bvf_002286 [Paramecium bursaria]